MPRLIRRTATVMVGALVAALLTQGAASADPLGYCALETCLGPGTCLGPSSDECDAFDAPLGIAPFSTLGTAPLPPANTGRLAGGNRFGTAVAISQHAFPAPPPGGLPVAYVTVGTQFPDALAGAPTARRGGGPLLLTHTTSLPEATRAELARIRPARIVVLGGPAAVSTDVEAQLRAQPWAPRVERRAGANRYATAVAISQAMVPTVPQAGVNLVYVAAGGDFADAMTGAAAAATHPAPLLLTSTASLPEVTRAELARLRPAQVILLGGSAVLSSQVADQIAALPSRPQMTRIAGGNRFETAAAISRVTYPGPGVPVVYLTAGNNFPDALAGAAVAGRPGHGPILLTQPGHLPPATFNELVRLQPQTVVILGGDAAVAEAVRFAVPRVQVLAAGVTHLEFNRLLPQGWIRVNAVSANLGAGPRAEYLWAGQVTARAPLTALAGGHPTAVAAINGDFFDIGNTGAPLGIGMAGGTLLTSANHAHPNAVVFDAAGRGHIVATGFGGGATGPHGTIPLSGLNPNFVPPDAVGAFNSQWGAVGMDRVVRGDEDAHMVVVTNGVVTWHGPPYSEWPIPANTYVLVGRNHGAALLRQLHDGDRVQVSYGTNIPVPNAVTALGGSHVVVRDGKPVPIYAGGFHPRSAVGFSADGTSMTLLTVDGHAAHSIGATNPQLGALLAERGAHSALILDGGGSSTMAVRRPGGPWQVVNVPSAGAQRWVPNGLLIRP